MPLSSQESRRLADRASLTSERPAGGLGPDRDAPLPPWVATLAALIAAAEANEPPHPTLPPFRMPGRPVAFESLLAPMVAWSLATLRDRAITTWNGLSDRAIGALAHALLQQLSGLSEACLRHVLAHSRSNDPSASPVAVAEGFAQALRQDGLIPFFGTFPVLGRLLARNVDQWLDNGLRFLQRLERDQDALARTFGGDPGPVVELRPYRSDRHRGGRSVHEVRFESGLVLAYKPKALTAEAAYGDLIAWVNRHDPPLDLLAAQTLPRDGYGWQRWLPAHPCADAERVAFLRRCGMLAALLQALGGVDFGGDNVVAVGAQPVPIDLETLCHPFRPAPDGVRSPLQESVWRTGLLPDAPGSGVHAPLGDVSFLGPDVAGPAADAVISGLAAMQAWLQRWREPLREQVAALAAAPLRFIARPTHIYTNLLRQMLQPACLQDGAAWSVAMEALDADRPDLLPLLASEQTALIDLDIPLFHHDADQPDLILPDGRRIREFFPQSGLGHCLERWSRSPDDDVAVARSCLQRP